jgi:excisionase family DNA binding protein
MPKIPPSEVRLLTPAQVAEIIAISIDDVMALVQRGELRGMRVGSPGRWRIEEASVGEYLDAQIELTRRAALWQQSQEASFPELWGTGEVRHDD